MTDGSASAVTPGDGRRPAARPSLTIAMIIAGLGGTGYFGASSVSAQREVAISRDEATRITAARNRYEDLYQHCQERESDRMDSRLRDLEGRR